VKISAVIPRLAKRAEGPRMRPTASAKCSASTSERTMLFACGTQFPTERSLAVCAARDDKRE
jgi:hypothetical protein